MISMCDECNFKTGNLTCWHFGKITPAEECIKALCGCDKYRLWWTVSTVHCEEELKEGEVIPGEPQFSNLIKRIAEKINPEKVNGIN